MEIGLFCETDFNDTWAFVSDATAYCLMTKKVRCKHSKLSLIIFTNLLMKILSVIIVYEIPI